MITYRVDQGSPEWHNARAGKITASMFSEARKRLKSGPNKGGFTAAADDYARGLAMERITGRVLQNEDFETHAMRRGHALEPEARALHEKKAGFFIEQTGFIATDCERFGASADGEIQPGGGAEYKCFVKSKKVTQILIEGNIDDYLDQVYGCMAISGADWWHFCLYCPDLADAGKDLTVFQVERNESYIRDMWADLEEFDALVQHYVKQLRLPTPGALVFDSKKVAL